MQGVISVGLYLFSNYFLLCITSITVREWLGANHGGLPPKKLLTLMFLQPNMPKSSQLALHRKKI